MRSGGSSPGRAGGLWLAGLVGLVLVSWWGPPAAAAPQAVVTEIEGAVTAQRPDGRRRALSEDSVVFATETVETGPEARVSLRFTDGSRFDLGPDGAMLVKQYTYTPRDPESRITTRIFRGTFRFVSGLIARLRPQAMRVELPVAVIGIRGTRVAGEADATSAVVVLLEPEDEPDRETAIEVSNDYGAVVVDRPGWGTEVPDAFSPPSPPRRMDVDSLNRLNRSIQTLRRVITPRLPPRLP